MLAALKIFSGNHRNMLLALIMALALPSRAIPEESLSHEYDIKGAFLFHFAQLVDWPSDVLPGDSQSITFCGFDDDPARPQIQNAVDGRVAGNRSFRFKPLRDPEEGSACHVIFLSRGAADRQTAVLRAVYGRPVLTVGETPTFLSDGGIVRFHLDSGRVRFDVNIPAADTCRVKISSRLLLLASYVLRNGPSEARSQ